MGTGRDAAVTGAVLAGGRGLRHAGQDKGLLGLRGRPLVAHVLERLAPQAGTLVINANRNAEQYAAFGVPVIADARPDFQGPLAGMASVLAATTSEWVVFVPCDAPGVPPDYVGRLRAAGTAAAYAQAGPDPLYTCCLLRRSLAPELARALDTGQRAVHRFLESQHASAVALDWPAALRNLNTAEALARAECPA
jgi:molybdopterin-guanine dinucleotide biosynthesis protein A